MDRTKTATSPQSSIDHDESTDQTNKAIVGRFYECNFCKGRFTNAQALGGHMNIHRKEKAIKASRAKAAKDQKHHHHMMMNYDHHHENCGSSFSSGAHEVNNINDQGIEWKQINGNELDLELRLGYK